MSRSSRMRVGDAPSWDTPSRGPTGHRLESEGHGRVQNKARAQTARTDGFLGEESRQSQLGSQVLGPTLLFRTLFANHSLNTARPLKGVVIHSRCNLEAIGGSPCACGGRL